MTGIIEFLIGYIILLICWLIINVFFYALTVATKKSFFYIPFAINTLLSWVIQIYFFIYPFYFLWQTVSANWGTWWLVILAFIIGLFLISFLVGFWRMIVGLFVYPIDIMTLYFSEKAAERLGDKKDDFDYEVISPKGKVIGKFQSESKVDKKLATYFVADYLVNLLYILMHPQQYTINGAFDFIFTPALFMLQMIIVFGLIIGVYNLIKHRKFAYPDKKIFLTNIFKLDIIVSVGLQTIATILYVFIS